MMADGSVRVLEDHDVTPSTSKSHSVNRKPIPASKGKTRAAHPVNSDVKLNPKIYLGFLRKFIHKQLYIRNTKDTIVEDYNVPQVMS